jgi:hypothetical protein
MDESSPGRTLSYKVQCQSRGRVRCVGKRQKNETDAIDQRRHDSCHPGLLSIFARLNSLVKDHVDPSMRPAVVQGVDLLRLVVAEKKRRVCRRQFVAALRSVMNMVLRKSGG